VRGNGGQLARGAGEAADRERLGAVALGQFAQAADEADQQGEEQQLQRAGQLRAHFSHLRLKRGVQGSQGVDQGLCGVSGHVRDSFTY
jgi:hypothetical protein